MAKKKTDEEMIAALGEPSENTLRWAELMGGGKPRATILVETRHRNGKPYEYRTATFIIDKETADV